MPYNLRVDLPVNMSNEEIKLESSAVQLPAISWDACHELARAEADPRTRTTELFKLADDLNFFYKESIGDRILCQGVTLECGLSGYIEERYADCVNGLLGNFATVRLFDKTYLIMSVSDAYINYGEDDQFAEPSYYQFIVSSEPGYDSFGFTLDENGFIEEKILREWDALLSEAHPAKIWNELNDYFNFLIESFAIQYLREAPKGTTKMQAKNWAYAHVASEYLTALEYAVGEHLEVTQSTTVSVVSEGALTNERGIGQKPVRASTDVGTFAGLTPFIHKNGSVDLRIAICSEEDEEHVTLIPCKFIVDFQVTED